MTTNDSSRHDAPAQTETENSASPLGDATRRQTLMMALSPLLAAATPALAHDDSDRDGGRRPRQHLSHEALIGLAPTPDVRSKRDAAGNYISGGVGVLIYDGVNAMDALGPYQTFSTGGLRPFLVSASRDGSGAYKKDIMSNSRFRLVADRTIADTPKLDVLVVAGGALETAMLAMDPAVLNWIKSIHQTSVYTTSVCTGSWVLGAAGILKGKRATGNWYRAAELLSHFGAIPITNRRYVFDGKILTGAGVTAGIDMALALVKKLYVNDLNDGRDYTQAVMLDLEYDPKPPINGGSVQSTDPYVFEGMQWMYDYFGLNTLVKSIPAP